jgi:hypothetical protein
MLIGTLSFMSIPLRKCLNFPILRVYFKETGKLIYENTLLAPVPLSLFGTVTFTLKGITT